MYGRHPSRSLEVEEILLMYGPVGVRPKNAPHWASSTSQTRRCLLASLSSGISPDAGLRFFSSHNSRSLSL